MGNNESYLPLNKEEKYTLQEFTKITKRKMNIHVLCDNKQNCVKFVENLTGEKFHPFSDELLEKYIERKISLFSFINYYIYDEPSQLIKRISDKSQFISEKPEENKFLFSEVVIILDNAKIHDQIKIMVEMIEDDDILDMESYFSPFFIFLSPKNLDLISFIKSKRFLYKIREEEFLSLKNYLGNLFQKIKPENQNLKIKKNEKNIEIPIFEDSQNISLIPDQSMEINDNKIELININEDTKEKTETNNDIFKFINKLIDLFIYFNELGDTFSFINSEGNEIFINVEENTDTIVFINILLLGRTGVGKSTLINLLLDDKKSFEGGIGTSTTSKDIQVYKKSGIPLRFYDVKGFENEKTVKNYVKIMLDYGLKSKFLSDNLNAIFYCIQYKSNGTVIEEMESPLFVQLVKLEIPILFIITNFPHNPYIENFDKQTKKKISNDIKRIEKAIKEKIKDNFFKGNHGKNAEEYIENFIKFYYVNLVKKFSPIFGLNKILSYFTELVSKEEWEILEKACIERNENECKTYMENNPFLKKYLNLENLNIQNKKEALLYLKRLKAGAFFSGLIPFLDIGMEYAYRHLFKKKLNNLYGFDEEKAKNAIQINLNNKENNDNIIYNNNQLENSNEIANRSEIKENEIGNDIDKKIKNKIRNFFSVAKGVGHTGGIAAQVGEIAAQFAIARSIQVACLALLPVTSVAFGAYSCYNINKDCHKILDIYDKAFTPLKFDTLKAYIESFRKSIGYLEEISQKFK